MTNWIHIIVELALFGLCFYVLSALRLESFFKKNSTFQIAATYFLLAMALAYLVAQFLFSLEVML